MHIIGIGLNNEKDITLKGLEIVKKCSKVYLENYTCTLNCEIEDLEKLYGNEIIPADREMVEKEAENTILKDAKKQDVAFLVVGDAFSATTHVDLVLRAKKMGIRVTTTFNASILTTAGIVGLELYKYGKTTSIVFPQKSFFPETPYDVIKMNKNNGLHTLCLLDIKMKGHSEDDLGKEDYCEIIDPKFMTVNEAIGILLKIEKKRKEKVFTKDTFCVGCARLASDNFLIKTGKAENLLKQNFGKPLHCLIIPGKLHFMEEEALKQWK